MAVRGRDATKRALDARQEFGGVERLRQVVVGAEHQPRGPVERVDLAGRDQDDRQLVVEGFMELSHDFEAVCRTRQLDLDDRESGSVASEALEQLVARRRRTRVVAQPNGHLYPGQA
jgi:hypothetical protein